MKLKLYQVDAFTEKIFGGNPAAVCPLENWLPDSVLQNIAMENNLAETAFYIQHKGEYHLRWFTPVLEVDLCGHATLATAHVMFNHEGFTGNKISFQSRSGILSVEKSGDLLTLDFPVDEIAEIPLTAELGEGFNIKPIAALKGKTDHVLVFSSEADIRNLEPDFRTIAKLHGRGIIVTAKGKEVDFVSRFFAPQAGIDEDPVTGSVHTTLTPYWAKVLGKTELSALQLSKRQGALQCKLEGNRVLISGYTRTYLVGEIFVD
ncbi:MAG: PhzF family phenazine biosynthesis isomerase [Chitinophagales bacterium]